MTRFKTNTTKDYSKQHVWKMYMDAERNEEN